MTKNVDQAADLLLPKSGETTTISFTASSSSTDLSTALASVAGRMLTMTADADVHLTFGATGTATTSHPKLASGSYWHGKLPPGGTYCNAIGSSGSGTLYVWISSGA